MSITDKSTAVTANSTGVIITSDVTTANTKGAWIEMIASTSEETYWVQLVLHGLEADESYLIDVGVGAAASEVVKIADIYIFGNDSNASPVFLPPMPLTIAVSSRVSLRCQATATSKTLDAMIYLSNDSVYGTSDTNETIGADTSGSKGTDIDPGATDDTKGGYTQLIASTSNEYNYWVVLLGNSDNPAQTNQQYLVDVGTGATPSAVIDNILYSSSAVEYSSSAAAFYETVATATKISAQCQSSNAAAAGADDRLIDIAMIGFNITAPSGGGNQGISQGLHTISDGIVA